MKVCVFLFVAIVVCACQQTGRSFTRDDVNELYNTVNKNRYTGNDSLSYYTDLLLAKAKGKAPAYQAMGHIGKGLFYSRSSNYPASLQQYQQAIAIVKKARVDSLLAKAYNGAANAHRNLGQYPQAIELFQQALTYYEKLEESESMAGVLSNLALTYQMKGDTADARRQLRQGLATLGEKQSSKVFLHLTHLMANDYLYRSFTDSALLLDEHGIRIAGENGWSLLLTPFFDNKANCYVLLNKPDSARFYFQRCIEIDSAAGTTKQVADTYLNLGHLETKQENWPAAEAALEKSIQLSRASGYRQGERDAWKMLALLWESRGDYSRTVKAQKNFAALNDSLINEETEGRIAELQAGYELGKKEQQIQLQAVQLSRQRAGWLATLGLALTVLVAIYAFYRRRHVQRQAQMQALLLAQKQEATVQILVAEEKERQRIATDLHDGIGQMMTAAWLNLQALGGKLSAKDEAGQQLVEKTTALVGESCTELRQVSHNMMPNALQRKGLVAAVKAFVGQLDGDLLSVRLQADEERLLLEPTTELIVYRVIQECVNNVVKHAQASELDISIAAEKDGLDILVEDNGTGFDVQAEQKGLGLQNIRSRIQYLNGTVEWNNTGSGTVVALFIPYPNG